MDLEKYIISAMCHYPEAGRRAIVELTPDHFTGKHQLSFSVVKGLIQLYGVVDLHVFVSQLNGHGGSEQMALNVFNYAVGQTGDWASAFDELKRQAIHRQIGRNLKELHQDFHSKNNPGHIAAKAIKFATGWHTHSEKRYMSGREIEESTEELGEAVYSGIPLYDEHVYKYGGNRKGQMKGVICRHKHGKSRSECWEVAQNLRQGHKVLYLTLEGTKRDILKLLKQVLKDDWRKHRDAIFIVDGVRKLDELEATVLEAVMVDQVDKVVVDYIQLVQPTEKYAGENEKINISVESFRHLMVKYNFHCVVLSQARKSSQYATVPKDADGNPTMPKGWKHVPMPDDAYGSQALINAASIVFIGFRPVKFEECIRTTPLGVKVLDPYGAEAEESSLFLKTAITRYKPEFLHQWWQFNDGNQGLQNPRWV